MPIQCLTGADLARLITQIIENMGGTVLLGPQFENLCRRASAAEVREHGNRAWVVEAQGLPNLIHELVHALFLGELADDHGFDYGQIPLDLARRDHRRHLWEELACCVLSTGLCAPLEDDPESFARDWFAEQFEIQGVFHGLEHDLPGFRMRVDAHLQIAEHRAELLQTVQDACLRVERAFAALGIAAELPPCDPLALWADYRSQWHSMG